VLAPGDGGVRVCSPEMCLPAEAAQAAMAGMVVAATSVGDGESVLAPAMGAAVVAARTRRLGQRRRRRFLTLILTSETIYGSHNFKAL
jgi:hypothetical protein